MFSDFVPTLYSLIIFGAVFRDFAKLGKKGVGGLFKYTLIFYEPPSVAANNFSRRDTNAKVECGFAG